MTEPLLDMLRGYDCMDDPELAGREWIEDMKGALPQLIEALELLAEAREFLAYCEHMQRDPVLAERVDAFLAKVRRTAVPD